MSLDSTCYCKDQGAIIAAIGGSCGDATPCKNSANGEIVQCCGSDSICGSDGFCFFTGNTNASISGYYMGGCTDPTYQDPACSQHCTDQVTQDVVWVNPAQKWACCHQGNNDVNCNAPSTTETFNAPPPYKVTFNNSNDEAVSGTACGATATVTISPGGTAPASADSSNQPSPLSSNSGVNGGIVALAVILVVVVLTAGGLIFWMWRKLKNRKSLDDAGQRPGTIAILGPSHSSSPFGLSHQEVVGNPFYAKPDPQMGMIQRSELEVNSRSGHGASELDAAGSPYF